MKRALVMVLLIVSMSLLTSKTSRAEILKTEQGTIASKFLFQGSEPVVVGYVRATDPEKICEETAILHLIEKRLVVYRKTEDGKLSFHKGHRPKTANSGMNLVDK